MSELRDWGKHPYDGYGDSIDWSGIRWGTKDGRRPKGPKAIHGQSAEWALEKAQREERRVEIRIIRDASVAAGLLWATQIAWMFSAILHDVPRETFERHLDKSPHHNGGRVCVPKKL
jgi:hypothetical protein